MALSLRAEVAGGLVSFRVEMYKKKNDNVKG